jgi:hypothetical protein
MRSPTIKIISGRVIYAAGRAQTCYPDSAHGDPADRTATNPNTANLAGRQLQDAAARLISRTYPM